MATVLAKPKLTAIQVVGVLAAAAGGLVASRYLSERKISSAQLLSDSLLESEQLREAVCPIPEATEKTLAACAAYLLRVALGASEGLGLASGADDPIGFHRTESHSYTHATATVLTEAPEDDAKQRLTYSVSIPTVGTVRGTRRVGGMHVKGLAPARPVTDTLQITLPDGYTAQMEAEWQLTEALVNGRARLFGAVTLRDNHANAGHLHVSYEGVVSGTITRDARIIGRFQGKAAEGVSFQQYQIEN